MFSVSEAAEILDLHPEQVRRHARAGRWKAKKHGDEWLFEPELILDEAIKRGHWVPRLDDYLENTDHTVGVVMGLEIHIGQLWASVVTVSGHQEETWGQDDWYAIYRKSLKTTGNMPESTTGG